MVPASDIVQHKVSQQDSKIRNTIPSQHQVQESQEKPEESNDVRVIEDSDDENQRFNNNMLGLGGRGKRASTKMVRIDDSSSSSFLRSDTTNTQFTSIKRVDTFDQHS